MAVKKTNLKLQLPSLLIDGQDGGYSVAIFESEEERHKYQTDDMDETDLEDFNPEDEYQNGYHGTIDLEYKIVKGKLVILGAWAHFGQ